MDLDLEFSIDFKSQQFIDNFIHKFLYFSVPVSFIVGFVTQNLLYLIFTFVIFIIVVLLVSLPSYPKYNAHKVNWLKAY